MNYLTRLKNLERPMGASVKSIKRGDKGAFDTFDTLQTRAFEKNNVETPQIEIAAPGCITDEWSPEDWRAFYDERAGIIKFDAGEPRPVAEARAFEHCVVRWLDHNPVRSDPGACVACKRAEDAQGVVVPYGSGRHGAAWLHPGCWSAWHAERRDQARAALASYGIEASETHVHFEKKDIS